MSLIPESKVDEVREATDLVDLISRYIPLTRSGSTFKAPCPFHQEKTPSFHVWPETATWKCFGCGKGGNAFHFLMEKEHLDFPEAVRALAKEAGIEIEEGERSPEASGDRDRLYETLEWACRFFQARLRSPEGGKAVEYCRHRGISGETARDFRVGYAPAGWRNLLSAARVERIPDDLLARTGLIRTGEREPYDWFRDRLMFPIQDIRGRVVGFGARAFGDDEPKYLNSPDTALFKKGSTLYALNLAREEVLKGRRIGIAEGYTDVLMAHQHGVKWLVAGLGTGLTAEHATLARRYADRVDLIYDADTAGARAAERALDAFLAVDADVRVVQLPGGQDPCDFLTNFGKEPFLERIEKGREVFDFLVDRAGERHDLETLNGRIEAVDEVLASVAKTGNKVKRDLLLMRVSEAFKVTESAVRDRLRLFSGRRGAVETGALAVTAEVDEAPEERFLIEAVVLGDGLAERLARDWPPEKFRHRIYRQIAAEVVSLVQAGGAFEPGAVVGRLADPDAGGVLATLLSESSGKRHWERQYEDCLRKLNLDSRLDEIREALAAARSAGATDEIHDLERELFRLRAQSP